MPGLIFDLPGPHCLVGEIEQYIKTIIQWDIVCENTEDGGGGRSGKAEKAACRK